MLLRHVLRLADRIEWDEIEDDMTPAIRAGLVSHLRCCEFPASSPSPSGLGYSVSRLRRFYVALIDSEFARTHLINGLALTKWWLFQGLWRPQKHLGDKFESICVEEKPLAPIVRRRRPFLHPLIRLRSGHFLRHEKQQSPVVLIRAAQQAAELGQHSSILSGAAPLIA